MLKFFFRMKMFLLSENEVCYINGSDTLPPPLSRKEEQAIFDRIAASGDIPERDMFNTFNMGVGMVVIVSPADAERALEVLHTAGEDAYVLGTVREGTEGVVLA
jgi:phosphoribosylformylglycinamidine cyclo-ligase